MLFWKKKDEITDIKFGFRGESIFCKFNGKQYEIWSTWIDGRRIYLDDLNETNLNDKQKIKLLTEIVNFIIQSGNEKPILCFNDDIKDSILWRTFSIEFKSLVKKIEVTTTKGQNESLYSKMYEELTTGKIEYIIKGRKIKTIKDLDRNWEIIKIS